MAELTNGLRIKVDSVKKLIRRNAKNSLERLLFKLHPADIAIIVKHLNDLERKKIWELIKDKKKLANIILELDDSQIIELMESFSPQEISLLLKHMESDDAANILRLLDEEIREKVLEFLHEEEQEKFEELLHYPEDSAGAIMNTKFFALPEDTTVKEATKTLHKAEDVEMVFYLYVIDSEGRLTGVLSLRQLILNPPDKKLKDIMIKDVISVPVDMDRENVAKIVEKYDLLAVPVVDDKNRLVGIITVDDVIDIIREETTEDIYKMAGTTEDELLIGDKPLKIAKIRFPWLLVTFAGELISGFVISFFHGRIKEFGILASFMPIVMALGGSVGNQSAIVLIRGLALGKVNVKEIGRIMFKEIRVGMALGLILGVSLGVIASLWYGNTKLGMIVGIAIFIALTFAAFLGTLIPTILTKLNIDPAISSTPFITTINDITGLTIYFSVSMLLMYTLM